MRVVKSEPGGVPWCPRCERLVGNLHTVECSLRAENEALKQEITSVQSVFEELLHDSDQAWIKCRARKALAALAAKVD